MISSQITLKLKLHKINFNKGVHTDAIITTDKQTEPILLKSVAQFNIVS